MISLLVYLQEGILSRKINLSISKNHVISQILGNKINIFTGRQSKTKNKTCFLPVRFDLELTSFLEICVGKKLWCSVFSNMRDTNCAFTHLDVISVFLIG